MKNQFGWNLQHSYMELPDVFYEKLVPAPVSNPKLVLYNERLGKTLGFDDKKIDAAVPVFAGNEMPENHTAIAQSYAGHQFGHFTMLGDGRARLIGEQIAPTGERFDIQLKGAGKTAYSRGGDGRAALGPMLREYIMSEAMHELGIPTTRSLAVVTTGETVLRETPLAGAILTRVASSHLRVGTFEFAARFGDIEDLVILAEYAINRHYPEVEQSSTPYLDFFLEVVKRQATLIAKWQLVGFIHGVMNTDNMTISGETIDYGPCAFMDHYDRMAVFSSIDEEGRYAYQNQPNIAAWNLARFAEAILPLLGRSKEEALANAQNGISEFGKRYKQHWFQGMRAKLGLFHEEKEDEHLIEELLNLMQHYHVDYTNTFLALTYEDEEDFPLGRMEDFRSWKEKWKNRLRKQDESEQAAKDLMRQNNPALIPRNRWVEDVIEAAVSHEDYTPIQDFLQIVENPFAHSEEQRDFAKRDFSTGDGYQTFCGT